MFSVKEEKYEKILCLLEFIFGFVFLLITWLIRPMTVLLGLLGFVSLINGIYDLFKILRNKKRWIENAGIWKRIQS